MATRTVTSDVYFDQIPSMATGDTINITTGAVLTVRQTNTAFPGNITVTDGTLHFDPQQHPTVPGTPIRFKLQSRDTTITVNNAGKISSNGGWYEMGTGDGTSGQTLNPWWTVNDVRCPHIQVETGAGTGVYEDWINIGEGYSLTNIPGDSSRGYYFYIVAGTRAVKCGNGTNAGPVFPNGAKVRCSNILLDCDPSYTTGSSTSAIIAINNGGKMDMTNFMTIHNYQVKITFGDSIKLTNCCFGNKFHISSCNTVDIDGLFIMRGITTNQTLDINNIYVGGTFKRFKSSRCQYRNVYIQNVFSVDFTDIWAASTGQANNWPCEINLTKDCTFTNLYVAGGYIYIQNYNTNLVIENIKYSWAFITGGVVENRMFNILNARGVTINNVSLWSADGEQDTYARPHPGGILAANNAFPVRITNVDMPYTNTDAIQELFYFNGLINDFVLANWDLGAWNYALFANGYNSNMMILGKLMNIKTTSSVLMGTNNLFGFSNVQLKTVSAQNIIATGDSQGRGIGGSSDMAFHTLLDSNGTDGRLALMANPESVVDYFSILSGTPYFNNANRIMMRTAGDSVEFVCPFPILGVSGIKNSAPTLVSSGVTLAHITISVKQEGEEWSSWYNLNTDMATLAGLTFDPAVNFYWKARITVTGNSSTQYFSTLHIPILLTNSVLYPVSLTTITLDNVVVGSTYYVYKNSDNSLIGSGTAIASTVEITDIPYASDENCTVRVRKPGYVPFETGIIMTEDGSSAWIAQVADTIYQE